MKEELSLKKKYSKSVVMYVRLHLDQMVANKCTYGAMMLKDESSALGGQPEISIVSWEQPILCVDTR